MCSCIEEVNARLAPYNGMLAFGFTAQGNNSMHGKLLIQTEKLDRSKRASIPVVAATYCPFCGSKLEE